MSGHTRGLLAVAAILAGCAHARPDTCTVPAKTDAGWLCGTRETADDGSPYASFRGVPYAKQPVGDLRFKELEPVEQWEGYLNVVDEGPICYQTDVLYGTLMDKSKMDEACIYANIHVPFHALPKSSWRPARELLPPRQTLDDEEDSKAELSPGLPILVFIHGGGFAFGSGHTDIHGPEYLVSKNVIVITFNYRLNVFGFLSLNSTKVPGNAGLRDMITLLRWVKTNAKAFGGDPDNVTLSGQSAGGIAAHLLTLSKAAEGLFKRAILMSGTANNGVYSPSPYYAAFVKTHLLGLLGINSTDADEVYQQLIDLPAEKLHEANNVLIDLYGFTTFVPTVETPFSGVTTVMDDYPENLIDQGRGKDIPLLVGYTDAECETFRGRLEEFHYIDKANYKPAIIVNPKALFSTSDQAGTFKKMLVSKYYNGNISVDGFVHSCTDGMYEYSVLKLVERREATANSPMYVYKFTFDSDDSVLKKAKGFKFHGAGHVEDLFCVFKTNSVLGSKSSIPPKNDEDLMRQLMPSFFVNFMINGKPISDVSRWPATNSQQFTYEDIHSPADYQKKTISETQREIIKFFDSLTSSE